MLYYTLGFLMLAALAAFLGFTGVAASAVTASRILFVVCLGLCIIAGLATLLGPRPRP